jgi:predicted transcriptional regulator
MSSKVVTLRSAAPSRVSDPDALEARREFRALRLQLWPSQLAASIELGIGRASVERYETGASSAPHKLICKMRRLVRERLGIIAAPNSKAA